MSVGRADRRCAHGRDDDDRGPRGRVKHALESADLSQFEALLAPNVRCGPPDDPTPPCRTRNDVLAWYERGRSDGRRAQVLAVDVRGDKLIVALRIFDVARPDVTHDRWQMLTCREGCVVDIRGFDVREQAIARAGI